MIAPTTTGAPVALLSGSDRTPSRTGVAWRGLKRVDPLATVVRMVHTAWRLISTTLVALVVAAGCIGGSSTIKGEIRDDKIVLGTDHAGSAVRFELHNSGTRACDIVLVLTSLNADALPVKDGQVVIVDGDSPGIVRPDTTYENQAPYTLGRILPGADFSQEIAMEGAPKGEDRVLLCNGVGDYQHGRFAPLRFDR